MISNTVSAKNFIIYIFFLPPTLNFFLAIFFEKKKNAAM